jgi:serine/threonine-protein kinase
VPSAPASRFDQEIMDRAQTLQPGYKLDRYELLCPIASGGMAVVWLARLRSKRGFEKLFAIKTIKTDLIHDVRFQEMFLDEARIASGIQHPNVAQILDLGEQDDVLYIVMEWVDGESLAKIRKLAGKRGTAVPLGVALRIVAEACAGLHAAHQLRDPRGKSLDIVHRDVSPQNILVSAAGSVRVIDFGIAKATNRMAGDTRSGIIKGKVHYMAPEQAAGHAIDRRADIWSIGVCLYDLVMGRLPFDGDSDVDVVRRLLSTEPAPRAGDPAPPSVAEVIAHSLARDPTARFSTAAAMQRAIETVIDKLGLPATNADVAEFLHAHFADLAEQRGAMVTNALESAQEREAGAKESQPKPRANDDVAFAPTILSSASPGGLGARIDTAPPTRRVGKIGPGPSPVPPKEESKLTLGSAALEMEKPAGLPKRRGLLWAMLVVAAGAGAWAGVRAGGVERVRAMLGSPTRSTPASNPLPAAPREVAPTPPAFAAPSPALPAPSVTAVPIAGATPATSASAASPTAQRVRGAPKAIPGTTPRSAASAAPITPPPEPPPAAAPANEEDNPYNN